MQYQNDDGQCEYFRKDNDALKTKRHTTIIETKKEIPTKNVKLLKY